MLLVACTSAFQMVAHPLIRPPSIATNSLKIMPRSVPQTRMSFDLAATYLSALNEHYYQTTVLQALTLVSLGDVLAQALEKNNDDAQTKMSFDWKRTARMGALGAVIGGLGTATWLRFLEAQFPVVESHIAASFLNLPVGVYEPILRALEIYGPEHGIGLDAVSDSLLVFVKATLDACVWAPIANTLYLVLTPLSEGKDLVSVGETLSEKFLPVMKSELSTFFPYNILAFAVIPPLVRPFTTGVVSMCFSTYISWITHLEPHLPPTMRLTLAGGPPESTLLAMAADASAVLTAMDRVDAAAMVVAEMDMVDSQAD